MPKFILAACCLAALAAGCGPSNGTMTKEAAGEATLREVGELYRNHQFAKKKPPAKLTDLNQGSSIAANGYEAVKSGRVVLLYGATLPDLSEEPGQSPSEDVLAYEAEVPEKGGQVLLLNRTIKAMTPDEFKAAKKAGTEAPPATSKKKG